jgi:hypothetical protein
MGAIGAIWPTGKLKSFAGLVEIIENGVLKVGHNRFPLMT